MKKNYFSSIKKIIIVLCMMSQYSFGVTSKITRHSSSSELLKGETGNTIISSRGSIQLGLAEEKVIKEFEELKLNSITAPERFFKKAQKKISDGDYDFSSDNQENV